MGMTSESYQQIRIWLQYHQSIGVSIFYLFVDGQAARPEVQAQLATLPGVTVVPRNEELIERQAHSRIWNETWLAGFSTHSMHIQTLSSNSETAAGTAFTAGTTCTACTKVGNSRLSKQQPVFAVSEDRTWSASHHARHFLSPQPHHV